MGEATKAELDKLREMTTSTSNAEVIRKSLALYMALLEQRESGFRKVELINAQGERRELIIL